MPHDDGPAPAVVALGGGRIVSQLELDRTAESVGRARLHMEDVLVEHGITDRDVVDAAVLLVSELGTDALQHGRGPVFEVAVTVGRRRVQVAVRTACAVAPAPTGRHVQVAQPALAPVGHPDVAPHSRTIIDMMADAWDLRQTSAERTAWFRLDL